MKENKNIDRLFQEQFRGFEETPDNQVWLNIEAELKKDKNMFQITLLVKELDVEKELLTKIKIGDRVKIVNVL